MYDYSSEDIMAYSGIFESIMAYLGIFLVITLIIGIITIISYWKIYEKAGKPGWASLIPFYSQYVLFELVGMKGWYIFLGLIPYVGSIIIAVMMIMAYVKLSNCFGKTSGFAVGLIFLPVIFLPMLAFGQDTYTKPEIQA